MTASPPPDPLRLRQCPACGYALEGLPPEGSCPECGRTYDQRTVILHGWSRGAKSTVATARPAAVVAWCALALWMAWHGIRDGRRDLFTLACAAAVVAYVALGLWRRWSTQAALPVQVWMSADGCSQVNATGRHVPPPMVPWSSVGKIDMREHRSRPGMHSLTVRCHATTWKGEVTAVDAIVECSSEQAKALAGRIENWRQPAMQAGASGLGDRPQPTHVPPNPI